MKAFSRHLLSIALVTTLAACEKEVPPRAEVARPAKLFTVEAPGSGNVRSFPGEVRATEEAELAFRVAGELVEFPATRGKRVAEGELLAGLDPADYQAAVDRAQAEFELARAQFERAQELIDRALIAEADYEKRDAMMKVRQAALTRAINDLDYTRIYAPFDGVVARRLAENFESVGAGQVVLVLQTGEMVDVTVDIPESIVARVERRPESRRREPVKVRFDSIGSELFEAVYKEHETQADPATLTYKVTFSMPTPESLNVLPGMTATVLADVSDLFGDESAAYQLPIEAVFAAEDQPLESDTRYVWKVDPETMRASRQGIRVGSLTGDLIVVLEGVETGDLIVAAGVNAVFDDMLLRPMAREAGL